MKKFRVEVRICNEYEIEIDDEALGNEFLINFYRYFAELETWWEHAEYIATKKAQGFDVIEGYGVPMVDGKKQPFTNEDAMNKYINIVTITDDDIDVDCCEI